MPKKRISSKPAMAAPHILIVDDHEMVRRGMRSLLSSRSEWKICGEAPDGIEALEQAKALHPAVILMDVSMPPMDGLEATRIIRRALPETKVVIISQNEPAIAERQAQETDAAAFVSKSEMSQHLLPTVAKLLGGGALGGLIREHDWSQTPLGPITKWPQSLKTSVNLILNSQHPMWIGWGAGATFLYNDHSSLKSFQDGFAATISAIFLIRSQPLMRFSRSMAL